MSPFAPFALSVVVSIQSDPGITRVYDLWSASGTKWFKALHIFKEDFNLFSANAIGFGKTVRAYPHYRSGSKTPHSS